MNCRSLMVAISAALAMLTGCSGKDHLIYGGICVTCFNNPVTGEPANYDPKHLPPGAMPSVTTLNNSMPSDAMSNHCGERDPNTNQVIMCGAHRLGQAEYQINFRGDVDTAAAILKETFGYLTPEEAIGQYGGIAGRALFSNGDNAWSATPGVIYVMKGPIYNCSHKTTVTRSTKGTKIVFNISKTSANKPTPTVEQAMEMVKTKATQALGG